MILSNIKALGQRFKGFFHIYLHTERAEAYPLRLFLQYIFK